MHRKLFPLVLLLFILSATGCSLLANRRYNDDTLVTTRVRGVTLVHRHIIVPPKKFTPINARYRALYPALVMNRPDFGGKVLRKLQTGKPYTVLGSEGHGWMAVAEEGKTEMIGYAPMRALVKSALYSATVRRQSPRPLRASTRARPKARKKTTATCITVDGSGKACRQADSDGWILE